MPSQKIFIVIPAFNEGRTIGGFFKDLYSQMDRQGLNATVVVIDDGSDDTSRDILTQTGRDNGIVLLRHEGNRGVARALETGFKWVLEKASADDAVVVLEADGTNDSAILGKMCDRIIDGYDVVIGSRHLPGGGMTGFPFLRKVISRFGNLTMRLAVGCPGVNDYTIFYRAYKTSALKRLADSSNGRMFDEEGFAANAELLLKIASFGARITEVPHMYRYDLKQSTSKMDIATTIRGYLNLINRFRGPVRNALINGPVAD